MSVILSSLVLIFSFTAEARDLACVSSGKIVQIEFGKKKQEAAAYCFNKEKTVLLSKSCQRKNCKAFENKKKFKIENFLAPMGKPGFRFCRELGGRPEIVEFFVEDKPYKLDRCLFTSGDFADTDFLLSHYIER